VTAVAVAVRPKVILTPLGPVRALGSSSSVRSSTPVSVGPASPWPPAGVRADFSCPEVCREFIAAILRPVFLVDLGRLVEDVLDLVLYVVSGAILIECRVAQNPPTIEDDLAHLGHPSLAT